LKQFLRPDLLDDYLGRGWVNRFTDVIKVGVFLSLMAFVGAAWAQPVGYRVVAANKTVIQIARDVYNDQRVWKEIAQANALMPPYELHKGQILVLPKPPLHKLPLENRVAAGEVPSIAKNVSLPSVKREITKDKHGNWIYTVNERAPTLQMIALEIYGDRDVYKELIKANNLVKPYSLSLGQKLKLTVKPLLNEKDGDRILISVWKKLTNDKMVARLKGDKPEEKPRVVASAPRVLAVEPVRSLIVVPKVVETKPAEVKTPEPVKAEVVKTEERKPFWTDFKMPEVIVPTVVAPAAPIANPPVYVVQMTSVPVGSICITPPQPFSNDPRWVIQPMPVNAQPGFINQMGTQVSAKAMNALVQAITGGSRAPASQTPTASAPVVQATPAESPGALSSTTSLPANGPQSPPPASDKDTTTDYWMGRDWKPPLKDGP